MRIGIITSNFGRLLSFLAGILVLEKHPEFNRKLVKRLRKTYWVFPDETEYPYVASLLRNRVKIVAPVFALLYSLLARNNLSMRYFVASQSDLDQSSTFLGAPNMKIQDLIPVPPLDARLKDLLAIKGCCVENIVIVHTRDSEWDASMGYSNDYVDSQYFRNSNLDHFRIITSELLKMGYSVVRTGRSKSPIFQDEIEGFFDYAVSDEVSDRNDFTLWSLCQFAIATMNGGANLGFYMSKPMLIWDYPDPIERLFNAFPTPQLNNTLVVTRSAVEGYFNDSLIKDLVHTTFLKNSMPHAMSNHFFPSHLGPIKYW